MCRIFLNYSMNFSMECLLLLFSRNPEDPHLKFFQLQRPSSSEPQKTVHGGRGQAHLKKMLQFNLISWVLISLATACPPAEITP